ncbi:MAG TPA: UDP-N-acetylmuramoyl-tripeptide--D-alanyl-D-alanine ligase, partial [Bacillales bacterium]|nr:UDP-N-acetylmuramoyl-tripeptide--D-alanyl-D-alanine ligase [Bacillales bacterium]
YDGHDFAAQAIEQGAVASLWQIDRPVPEEIPADFPLFFLDDTLEGLHRLAKQYLRLVHPKVIAVTGSNGKTTTKDMIEGVLGSKFQTHKTKGNMNNHIGLPLTILSMPEECEALILEMGMNHFGEISLLSKLSEPDLAVITNIGESHIEFLGSREGIAKAKMEITDGLKPEGKVIFDGDEPLLDVLKKRRSLACGYNDGNDLRISSVRPSEAGTTFSINEEQPLFDLPVLGDHNVKNASFAIGVGRETGMTDSDIAESLKQIRLTNMRFQRIQGKNGAMLINDAYNASPTSMRASIRAVKELNGFSKKVLVLGDMHELGPDEKTYHESVAESIEPPITDVITVGDRARWIAEAVSISVNVTAVKTKEEAAEIIEPMLAPEAVILFKASRAVELEEIVDRFSE